MKPDFVRATLTGTPNLSLFALLGAGALLPSQALATDINSSITLTSDYVWRGSTQTSGNPALQAGVKVVGQSGLYASVWASNVRFSPSSDANSEVDYTVGWSKSLNDAWALDVNVLHYQYPSTRADLDWTEVNSTVSWKDRAWASVGYSNEALGYEANGVYAQVGAKLPLNDLLRLETSVAHYFLNDRVIVKDNYTHGALSAIWMIKSPVEARLTVHASDANAKTIFGRRNAGTRAEIALQASF